MAGPGSVAALGDDVALAIERTATGLRADFREAHLARVDRPATAYLPASSRDPVRLVDATSSLSVTFGTQAVHGVDAEIDGGTVVYRAAHRLGGDVVLRPTPEGVEDFVRLPTRPEHEAIDYSLGLGDGVVGLRLVADTLELLDDGGAPRLRIAPPSVVGSDGLVRAATLEVRGCAFDASPAPPWGRPVVDPGARSCTVRVAWSAPESAYPLLVDPAWTSTGSLATPRAHHREVRMSLGAQTGKVLVCGGQSSAGALASCELYDPATGTWAATGALATARMGFALRQLPSGAVLAATGCTNMACTGGGFTSAERWNPATGTWSPAASLSVGRSMPAAFTMTDGKIFVAGGGSLSGVTVSAVANVDLYDEASNTWTAGPALSAPRYLASVTRLNDGRMLVAGGASSGALGLTSSDLFTADGLTRTAGPAMTTGRAGHLAQLLANGTVLVAGGYSGIGITATAEVLDPVAGTASAAGSMSSPRALSTTGAGSGGAYLAAGGGDVVLSMTANAVVDAYDPASNTWKPECRLVTPRVAHSSFSLASGKLLVVGGFTSGGGATGACELFDPAAACTTCTLGSQCASGFCVDGVCCSTACTGTCQACAAPLKASGTGDGTCGPAAAGTDPRGSCPADATTTCLRDGMCDGAGACRAHYPAGTSCSTSGTCVGTVYKGLECNGSGTCGAASTGKDCAPYGCTATGCRVTCGADTDCAPTAFCDAGVCFPKYANAHTCTVSGMCTSGFCVDGVCCNAACTGLCMACTAALKGAGASGVCGAIVAGADPEAECTDDGSPSCQNNGTCDGVGGCRKYPTQTGCQPEACTGPADCTSGFCVDGVCCDSGCTEGCKACTAAKKGSGVDGVCGPVAADTDPNSACPQDSGYPSSCQADGLCDGAGVCRQYAKSGVACGATTCVAGVQTGHACSGSGGCQAGTTVVCAPYKCAASGDACATTCATDGDCAPEAHCTSNHTCENDKAAGEPCTIATECASGLFCADGVCCSTACSGSCEACDVKTHVGTCVPVPGAPHAGHPACLGSGTCAGTCNGTSGATCAYPGATIPCATKCEAGAETIDLCDGQGACAAGAAKDCAPYVCDGATACKKSCASGTDCSAGYSCEGTECLPASAKCIGPTTLQAANGDTIECAPYRCALNQCGKSCTSVDDCSTPNVCDTGKCVPPPPADAAPASDGGCGCRTARGGGGSRGAAVIGVLAAVLLRARRRIRGRRTRGGC